MYKKLWNMLKDEIDKVINAYIIDKDDDVKNAWVAGGKHTLVEVRSYMDRIQSQENISSTFFERENKTQDDCKQDYRVLCDEVVNKIEEIDKKSNWPETEPEWWLMMMKLQRMAYEHRETLK